MGANVTVSGWSACINELDGTLVVSCTVDTNGGKAGIPGVVLILNTAAGKTVATGYTGLSGGCSSASPSLNLIASDLSEGDSVMLAADGQADGEHFFFEEKVSVGKC